jgi:hypothetical protein
LRCWRLLETRGNRSSESTLGKRLAGIAVLGQLLAGKACAGGIPPDKLSHFATSVGWGAAATGVTSQIFPEHRLVSGIVLGTIPGLIVEIVDSTGDAGFSGGDLLADLLGSAVGALITDKIVLKLLIDDHGPEKSYGVEAATKF